MPDEKNLDLLTPSEAARLLGLSADRVRGLADEGQLPVRKTTTGRRLFLRGDVEAFGRRRAAERKDRA